MAIPNTLTLAFLAGESTEEQLWGKAAAGRQPSRAALVLRQMKLLPKPSGCLIKTVTVLLRDLLVQ